MKIRILSFTLLISFLCVACNQPADALSEDTTPSVEGVWKMTAHFFLYENGDTAYVEPGPIVSHKIYLDGHVMWTYESAPDSTEWHGFGTYELRGDTLIEKLSCMSLSMQEAMGEDEEVILIVEFDENNFRQYIEMTWQDTVYYNTEVYVRVKH